MSYRLLHIKNKKIRFIIRDNPYKIPDDYIINEIWNYGDYIKEGVNIAKNFTVIDIGAHIGAFTVLAAKCARRGKIFSYEPNRENYELLKKNLVLNNLKNVKIYPLGVTGHKKTIKLYIDEENNAGHSTYKKTDTYELIKCIPLAKIFTENNIDICHFLKIDCEGSEYEILFKLPRYYFKRIYNMAIEYHRVPPYGRNLRHLKRILKKMGFEIKIRKHRIGWAEGILYARNIL